MNDSPQYIAQHGAMEFTNAPADLDDVRRYRVARVREQLVRNDYVGVLVFDPLNTRYTTDSTNMQVWCTHYETRCALIMADGPVVLLDYGNYPFLADGLPTVDEYRVMPALSFFGAGHRIPEAAIRFGNMINDIITEHGGGNQRLAVDRLGQEGSDALRSHGLELFEGQAVMETARSVKSAGELKLMREAIRVCQLGMDAMHSVLEPGITENALWSELHRINIANGGEWIETRLLASGPRTNPWFHESSMRVIEAGDMVSFDTDLIGPYGYCADMSRAWVCGAKPTAKQRELYQLSYEQIQHDIAILKAGMTFREVSQSAWTIPDEYCANKYGLMVHGVGLADEWPAIPYPQDWGNSGYDGVIEAGMVLSVESFIGSDKGGEGVKLEEMVLVTESGTEPMSTYHYDAALLGC